MLTRVGTWNNPCRGSRRLRNTPPDLVAVFGDGGRMRTREPDQGRGVHQPHWRETKNAAFHRMQSRSFDEDPQAELPDCFCNQAYVEKLVNGLKCLKNAVLSERADVEPLPATGGETVAAGASTIPAVASDDGVSHVPQFVGWQR